jgi:sodium/hydrogen antiporter
MILVTLLFVGYALFSRRMARSSITGPIVFLVAGCLVTANFLASGDSIASIDIVLESSGIQTLLEVTLVIVLFTDAVAIDVRSARREAFLPGRLLGIGLPLTIIAGTVAAMLVFPGLPFWPAAVLAVVLAPTDAALGQAVVSNEDVPAMVRQGLGIESGLNDGIAVPFLAIAIAGATADMQTASEIATVFGREIGLAIVVGLGIGWVGAKFVTAASSNGWAGKEGRQVAVPLLAILSFLVADDIGGSGFIAAFIAGLVFGAMVRNAHPDIGEFSEIVGHLMTMLAFFVFGALVLLPALEFVTWRMVAYAIVSLTIVRMLPVAVALIGTSLANPTKWFLAWFGPRGLASLVFVGTVVVESRPEDGPAIVAIGAVTVGLSVLLHGITAWPASVRYARWFGTWSQAAADDGAPELQEVEHIPAGRLSRPMSLFRPVADSDDR